LAAGYRPTPADVRAVETDRRDERQWRSDVVELLAAIAAVRRN